MGLVKGIEIAMPGQSGEGWRVATAGQWLAASVAAQEFLCRGEDGACVDPRRETWELAIAREAATFLASDNLGRPKGPVPREWVRIIFAVAERASVAPDGRVAGPRGLRLRIASLPRSPR